MQDLSSVGAAVFPAHWGGRPEGRGCAGGPWPSASPATTRMSASGQRPSQPRGATDSVQNTGLGFLGIVTPRREPVLSRMKVFLSVLLAALLGVEQAHSLVCFSCTNQNSNFYCLKPTICSDSDNYCVTVSAAAGIGNVVDFGHSLNKGCSPVCPAPPNIDLGVASMGTYCCQSFLCNISAADGGLRASTAMLGLGLLLSLLSALLRLGP